jgi:hypothetical protein
VNTLATWFYGDDAKTSTYFPQIGLQSYTDNSKRIYWDCVWVFYVCAKKTNPQCRLVFFFGGDCGIYGQNIIAKLLGLGVILVDLKYTYKPPAGFSKTFGNQMFIFDILDWVGQNDEFRGVWCILDSDCLVLGDLSQMWADASKVGALTYDLKLPMEENINGITQYDLTRICINEKWGGGGGAARYFGGEYFCAEHSIIDRNRDAYREIITTSYLRWAQGDLFCTEEAHMLSCWYKYLGVSAGTANPYIKRIWTGFRHNNRDVGDFYLPIWHVPAEKKTGIARLFNFLEFNVNVFKLNDLDYKKLVSRYVGIPNRTFLKLLNDLTVKINEKI